MTRPPNACAALAPVIFAGDARFTAAVTQLEAACFMQPWPRCEVGGFLSLAGDVLGLGIAHQGLVALVGGRLAGYALLTHRREETQLHRLAVAPVFRRRSVGRRLLEEVGRESQRRRLAAIACVVREDNLDGLCFLRACGYRAPAAGAIQPDAFRDGATGIVMAHALASGTLVVRSER